MKRQVPVFPAESIAEQLTSVFPTENVSFGVWEQDTVRSPSTLSSAVGLIVTVDEMFSPISVVEVTFAQLRIGASLSGKKNGLEGILRSKKTNKQTSFRTRAEQCVKRRNEKNILW